MIQTKPDLRKFGDSVKRRKLNLELVFLAGKKYINCLLFSNCPKTIQDPDPVFAVVIHPNSRIFFKSRPGSGKIIQLVGHT